MLKVISAPSISLDVPSDMKALRELAIHRLRVNQRERLKQTLQDLNDPSLLILTTVEVES